MVLFVLSVSPVFNDCYIQAIEAALNIADANADAVNVLLDDEFLDAINEDTLSFDYVKRLGQLSLYEIPMFSTSETILEGVKISSKRALVEKADKVVVF